MVRISKSVLAEINEVVSGRLVENVDLSQVSNWRTGGRARYIISARTTSEVSALRRIFSAQGIPHAIIGRTTNLLFCDKGLSVPCIRLVDDPGSINISGDVISAFAGVWIPRLARFAMKHSMSGLEHTCGIPGSLGGLAYMNGGTQRKGIGSSILSVESVTHNGEIILRELTEDLFSYRKSIFQELDEVITSVTIGLSKGDKSDIRKRMILQLRERNKKFPRKEPNCGSVFKSNPAHYNDHGPPGKIIEDLGLKGCQFGGAVISPTHANFIVNKGGAASQDIIALISKIKVTAYERYGIRLESEVRYVNQVGVIKPADEILGREL